VEDQLASIRAVLAVTPSRWRNLIETLPNSLISRSPLAGEWSALECLSHLRIADRDYFSARSQVFLKGGTIVPIDSGASHTSDDDSPQEAIDDFERLRQENLVVLDRLTDADLSRTAHHPEYGTVHLSELLNEWAAHDLAHTIQAERALMQPFIAASGPWRWSFADLDVANEPAK
jgi:hypothetical protein